MKRIVSLALCCLLFFSLFVSANAIDSYSLYFDIDFERNIIFSKYDVNLYLDDQKIVTLTHGEYYTGLVENVEKGQHDLRFCRADKESLCTSKQIDIQTDSTAKFKLSSESQKIKISKFEFSSGIAGLSMVVPDLENQILSTAKQSLKDEGFTNVTFYANDGSHIISESNWFIISQEPVPETVQDKNAPILLKCDHEDKFVQDHFSEHSVAEAYNIADDLNCILTIRSEGSLKNIDQLLEGDPAQADKWIVTEGSISSAETRKLKLNAYYTGNVILDDYRGLKLSKAIDILEEKNISNISYKGEDGASVALTSNWYVINQSKSAGETIPANEGIFLTVTKDKERAEKLLLEIEKEEPYQIVPTPEPTVEPITESVPEVISEPSLEPTSEPTAEPTPQPTPEPTVEPTQEPAPEPTNEPAPSPIPEFKSITILDVMDSDSSEDTSVDSSSKFIIPEQEESALDVDPDFLLAQATLEDAITGVDGLTYKAGNSSNTIREAQKILKAFGYLSWYDGVFGDNTASAVKKFQQANNLDVSGNLDVETQLALILNSPSAETETTSQNTIIIFSENYAAITWEDGGCYIGVIDTQNNIFEGTYIFPNGDYYYGSFKNNERSGQGTAIFTNGDIYVGNWENDTMSGKGIYYFGGYSSGEKYDGNWKNGMMSGSGVYTLANGTKITGTWENNKHKSW